MTDMLRRTSAMRDLAMKAWWGVTGVHPIAWGKTIGDDKIWYTALGHFAELYTPSSELVKLILAGVKWAAMPNHIKGQEASIRDV